MTTTAFTNRRELAHRTADGIEISLLWSKPSTWVTLAVLDTRSDETLEFDVDGSAALDAFNHPYATPPRGAAAASRRYLARPLTDQHHPAL